MAYIPNQIIVIYRGTHCHILLAGSIKLS